MTEYENVGPVNWKNRGWRHDEPSIMAPILITIVIAIIAVFS